MGVFCKVNIKEKKVFEYQVFVKVNELKINFFKNCILVFLVGGVICDVG